MRQRHVFPHGTYMKLLPTCTRSSLVRPQAILHGSVFDPVTWHVLMHGSL